MSDWAIQMITFLTILLAYCMYRTVKAPNNSPIKRLYIELSITCVALIIGCTYL